MKRILIILLALIMVACSKSDGDNKIDTKVSTESTDNPNANGSSKEKDAEKDDHDHDHKDDKKDNHGHNHDHDHDHDNEGKIDPSNLQYKSIIAGSASVAEYLAKLQIPVAGVTDQDSIPEVYKDAKRIGLPRKLNLEIISSLNPDLFVGDKTLEEVNTKDLGNFEVEKLYLTNSSFEAVFNSIEELGAKFGREELAKKTIEEIKSKESEVLSGIDSIKDKKVVVLFGTGESYKLATENSFIGSLLEKLGVKNLAKGMAKGPRPYVDFSLENIVAENPDYILTLSHGNKEQAKKMFEAEMEKELWKSTTASKEGNVISLNDKDFPVTGNIHIMETLEELKELLVK